MPQTRENARYERSPALLGQSAGGLGPAHLLPTTHPSAASLVTTHDHIALRTLHIPSPMRIASPGQHGKHSSATFQPSEAALCGCAALAAASVSAAVVVWTQEM